MSSPTSSVATTWAGDEDDLVPVVIFVPFLGVLVYLIARGGGMTQRTMEQQQEMRRQQDEYVRSVAATSGGGSSADQIASAKQLLDAGTITQAEFDQLKAKALA